MIRSLSLGAKSAAEIVREVIREAEDNSNKGGAGKLVVNFFPFILGWLACYRQQSTLFSFNALVVYYTWLHQMFIFSHQTTKFRQFGTF